MRGALTIGLAAAAAAVAPLPAPPRAAPAQPRAAPASTPTAAPAPTVAPGPAAVSVKAKSLGSHDSNAPVDVDADRIEVQDRADRAVFSGNVRVRQADMTLTAQRLTVSYSKQAAANGTSSTQIDRMDATGGVTIVNPTERAAGSIAIYDLNTKLVTMLGNVVLTKGGNVVRGGRAVLDLNANRATVDGAAVGGGASAAPGGRVSGRFTAPQKSGGDAPATPKP